MSLRRDLSRKNAPAAAKKSKVTTLAVACLAIFAIGGTVLTLASGIDWVVTDNQLTPVSSIPSQADGAFYFVVDPSATATL
ncbi:MAG: hypothetical protein HKN27_07645 [Silicimonas sp.]|nr:hypothetical protein [Silicimonas sp.]